jgi:endo-1,4-beta-xylanase
MKRLLTAIVGVFALATVSLLVTMTARPAAAATLTPVTGFGANPTNLGMYVYVPEKVAARPALLVAVHYCSGSAQAFFGGVARDYVTAADRYGYVILFPEATRDGHCFDVSTPQALKRDGGSDSTGIAAMVRYAQRTYHTDPARTYLTGTCSPPPPPSAAFPRPASAPAPPGVCGTATAPAARSPRPPRSG